MGGASESSEYVDSGAIEWRATAHEGVSWKKLEFERASGRSAVLLRFAPGASYAAHRHPGGERYLVLEGSLEDGGRSWGAGTWVRHGPGSAHRPSSREGCLLLVLLDAPIEELEEGSGRERCASRREPRADAQSGGLHPPRPPAGGLPPAPPVPPRS